MGSELWRLLKDRRLWTGCGVWVVGILIAVNVGAHFWYRRAVAEQLQRIQADFESEQKLNSAGDKTPRYDLSCGEHLDRYWSSVPDARQTRLAILSGMSQNHTINDRQPGDQLICQWLDDALAAKGTRVWGFAAPNLCNEETTFQLIALLSDPARRPRFFMYAICFDKMRNVDLRPGYQQFLREHAEIQEAWQHAAEQYKQRYPKATAKMELTLADIRKTASQQGESLESTLRRDVAVVAPLVKARKEMNVWAQVQLMLARNAILHIQPSSKRPIIQDRYDMNWEFLRMITDICKANGVQPIYYIIPLNPRADNPYIPEEYARFKEALQDYCAKEQIPFANLENVVPSEDWGTFMGGPDFKHFKGAGHKLTAEAVLAQFGSMLAPSATEVAR